MLKKKIINKIILSTFNLYIYFKMFPLFLIFKKKKKVVEESILRMIKIIFIINKIQVDYYVSIPT